jgi:hypothetical protein
VLGIHRTQTGRCCSRLGRGQRAARPAGLRLRRRSTPPSPPPILAAVRPGGAARRAPPLCLPGRRAHRHRPRPPQRLGAVTHRHRYRPPLTLTSAAQVSVCYPGALGLVATGQACTDRRGRHRGHGSRYAGPGHGPFKLGRSTVRPETSSGCRGPTARPGPRAVSAKQQVGAVPGPWPAPLTGIGRTGRPGRGPDCTFARAGGPGEGRARTAAEEAKCKGP